MQGSEQRSAPRRGGQGLCHRRLDATRLNHRWHYDDDGYYRSDARRLARLRKAIPDASVELADFGFTLRSPAMVVLRRVSAADHERPGGGVPHGRRVKPIWSGQ